MAEEHTSSKISGANEKRRGYWRPVILAKRSGAAVAPQEPPNAELGRRSAMGQRPPSAVPRSASALPRKQSKADVPLTATSRRPAASAPICDVEDVEPIPKAAVKTSLKAELAQNPRGRARRYASVIAAGAFPSNHRHLRQRIRSPIGWIAMRLLDLAQVMLRQLDIGSADVLLRVDAACRCPE